MADRLLMEDGTSAILLEDGTSAILLEAPAPLPVALNNLHAPKVGDGMSTAADHRFKR